MADWQEAVQASVIALIFALMVAKLVSVVISFRGGNLRVVRHVAPEEKEELLSADDEGSTGDTSTSSSSESGNSDEEPEVDDIRGQGETETVDFDDEAQRFPGAGEEERRPRDADVGLHPLAEDSERKNSSSDVEAEVLQLGEKSLDARVERVERKFDTEADALGELSDSDDWEGIESSELEETFGAASTFVATQAVGPGLKVSNETQLLLYGLYKLATEGPCSTPQPLAYKMSARAKWNAWQKLGNIGQEEAMQRYIAVVSEFSPTWAQGAHKTEKPAGDNAKGDASQRPGMGPVFSSLVMTEEGGEDEGTVEAIHVCAREGDQAGLQEQLENGSPVDLRDSDGRSALHWAADRGHLHAVELLLAKGAQINAKDLEGQTALHYATTCEQEEIAKYLVQKGAEPSMEDNEGVSPLSSHPGHWFWMGGKT